MPSLTLAPGSTRIGTTKYSVSRREKQGMSLALPGEKLYNIIHVVRPGAVVQALYSPVQAFGGSDPQKLPHFLFFIFIVADNIRIASMKNAVKSIIFDISGIFCLISSKKQRFERRPMFAPLGFPSVRRSRGS